MRSVDLPYGESMHGGDVGEELLPFSKAENDFVEDDLYGFMLVVISHVPQELGDKRPEGRNTRTLEKVMNLVLDLFTTN